MEKVKSLQGKSKKIIINGVISGEKEREADYSQGLQKCGKDYWGNYITGNIANFKEKSLSHLKKK